MAAAFSRNKIACKKNVLHQNKIQKGRIVLYDAIRTNFEINCDKNEIFNFFFFCIMLHGYYFELRENVIVFLHT